VPSFKGYHGFPASICASVNNQVVHGIPSKGQVLADGDLISIDCGAILEGWHGDAAVTVPVGSVDPVDLELSEATRKSMSPASRRSTGRPADRHLARGGERDQGRRAAHGRRYGIVKDYGGHGIGRAMHMEPFLPNYGKPGKGRGCGWAWPSPSSRCSPWFGPHRGARRRLDRRPPPDGSRGRPLGALRRHHRRRPWVLTARRPELHSPPGSTAARPG
jgi:methionine aminopeptidase